MTPHALESEDHTCSLFGFGAERGPAEPRLVAVWEGGSATLHLPKQGELVLGRSNNADFRIQSSSVSRAHAKLRLGETITVEDMGSSNGTRLNGQLIPARIPHELAPGAMFELGSVLVMLQSVGKQRTGEESLARASSLPPTSASLLGWGAAATSPRSSMAELHRIADLVATGNISVILRGETGSGKEVLAARIHDRSPRVGKPLVRINCAAFGEASIEAELFGHERGSFAGSLQSKPGLLEAAQGGTILLDQVGDLPLAIQAKLLRAIGNREILRVGATRPTPIDVRFIAATQKPLETLVEAGTFRADLFFRLNGITLEVPPLRERPEEILGLAQGFARKAGASTDETALPLLSAEAERALLSYDFPGNIRELASVIERALLLSQGQTIELSHLVLDPRPTRAPSGPPRPATAAAPPPESAGTSLRPTDLKDQIRELERQRIVDAIAECGGSQTKAAIVLGISRRALLHRLDAYDLPRPRKGRAER